MLLKTNHFVYEFIVFRLNIKDIWDCRFRTFTQIFQNVIILQTRSYFLDRVLTCLAGALRAAG